MDKFIGMPVDEFVDRYVLSMITQRVLYYSYRDPDKYPTIFHEIRWKNGGWLVFNPLGGMLGSCINIDGFSRNKVMKDTIIGIILREYEGVRKSWDRMIYMKQ